MKERNFYTFIKAFIASSFFNLFFVVWTVAICSLGFPFFIFGVKRTAGYVGYIWSYVVLFMLKILCGIEIRVTGAENLPTERPFTIVSKHQSALETIFFLLYFRDPIFVLKKELTRIPIYGWYLKAMDMICIDRSGGHSALKFMLNNVKKVFADKRVLVIFPEGKRTKVGKVEKLQPGIVAIYNISKSTPIIPVSLNTGLCWPKGAWIKWPCVITLSFAPMFPDGYRKDELLDYISKHINLL